MADILDSEDLDYESNLDKAKRLQKLADALRKSASDSAPPSAAGTMVGRHYIAPSTSAMLAPLAGQIRAQFAQSRADAAAKQARTQGVDARTQFLNNIPQPTPGHEMAGPLTPEQEDAGQTSLGTTPPAPVSRGQVLKYALQGQANPATAAIAKAYGDSTIKDMDADEARADKNQQRTFELVQNLANKEQDRGQRMDALREQIAARDKANQDSSDLKRYLATLQAQSSADRTAMMGEVARIRAEAVGKGKTNPADKPLPNQVVKELTGLEDHAANMTDLSSTFKDNYSGLGQSLKNINANYNPLASGDDATQWWKKYSKQSSLEEAHRLFGSAFTDAEQARWKAADISPDMRPSVIRKNLAIRQEIAQRMFANGVDRYTKAGYNKASEAFDPSNTRPVTAPQGNSSVDEALKLYGK